VWRWGVMSNPAIEFLRVVRRRRAVALLAFLAVLFAAACGDDGGSGDGGSGSGDETEETVTGDDAETLLGPADPASGDPVRVGLVSDGASQAFDNTDELRAGEATADYFNARKGGIAGRPIELVTCETGASPAGAADCANQMIEEGVVAVTMSQSAVAEALWEQLHAAGVPTMFAQASGSSMEADTESTFMVFNPITTCRSRCRRPKTTPRSPSWSSTCPRRWRSSSATRPSSKPRGSTTRS
jgi:branched-chain amino acid transport system substrate-binding protein